MHYLLTFLLLFGMSFGQKVVSINKTDESGQKIEIKKEIKDGKISVSITENGKTEEYTADLDDEKSMAELDQNLDKKLAEYDLDGKITIDKNIIKHDCKKGATAHKDCERDYAWRMCDKEDGDGVKKMIKFHEPMMMKEPSGFLGVHIQDLTGQLAEYFKIKDGKGVLVSEVVEDGPADKAGLKAGDIITKIDDKDISTTAELSDAVREYAPESKVTVSVLRDGKSKNFKATLGEANVDMFLAHHNFEMPKMPEMENFDFHALEFDKDKLQAQVDALKDELQNLKLQFKKFQEEN